jgi:hypothetical protein
MIVDVVRVAPRRSGGNSCAARQVGTSRTGEVARRRMARSCFSSTPCPVRSRSSPPRSSCRSAPSSRAREDVRRQLLFGAARVACTVDAIPPPDAAICFVRLALQPAVELRLAKPANGMCVCESTKPGIAVAPRASKSSSMSKRGMVALAADVRRSGRRR